MGFPEKYLKRLKKLDELKLKQVQLKDELSIAYEYKEDVIGKIKFADEQIDAKQQEYHELLINIQTELSNVKSDMDEAWSV